VADASRPISTLSPLFKQLLLPFLSHFSIKPTEFSFVFTIDSRPYFSVNSFVSGSVSSNLLGIFNWLNKSIMNFNPSAGKESFSWFLISLLPRFDLIQVLELVAPHVGSTLAIYRLILTASATLALVLRVDSRFNVFIFHGVNFLVEITLIK
jgi:hypothetical protein